MPMSEYPSTVLLDTNVLVRAVSLSDPLRALTISVIEKLDQAGTVLFICPQNMQEYRQVATRPLASNGFGKNSTEVAILHPNDI